MITFTSQFKLDVAAKTEDSRMELAVITGAAVVADRQPTTQDARIETLYGVRNEGDEEAEDLEKPILREASALLRSN